MLNKAVYHHKNALNTFFVSLAISFSFQRLFPVVIAWKKRRRLTIERKKKNNFLGPISYVNPKSISDLLLLLLFLLYFLVCSRTSAPFFYYKLQSRAQIETCSHPADSGTKKLPVSGCSTSEVFTREWARTQERDISKPKLLMGASLLTSEISL